MKTAAWTAAAAIALLWPMHALSIFDGVPLDRRVEAIAIGLIVPALWAMHRTFITRSVARALIVALVALKTADALFLTQQGLCGVFAAPAPIVAEVLTIPIVEPRGFLRSWDARADWRADTPACTAILSRPLTELSAFPAWFLNIVDFGSRGQRALTLDVHGFIRVSEPGQFSVELDRDVALTGHLAASTVSSSDGNSVSATLEAGVHPIDLHLQLMGDRWRFVPRWNGRDAFGASAMTVAPPRNVDRWLAPAIGFAATIVVTALVCAWAWSFLNAVADRGPALIWCAAASFVLVLAAITGRFERMAGPLLLAGVFVPMPLRDRNVRGAWLLLGVPWLAFFVARSLPLVGHFSAYSDDDWLAYQVAGYRIYMNGFWLEGGSKLFDYQPLYRWISGALHLVFGDSSVGETYWDAACLLVGGLVAFSLVRAVAGFRAGLFACAATLATFTLGTTWYFVGRGLSEITAGGFAFLSAFFLLRSRLNRNGSAIAAGAFATLMFYTRLNQLLFAWVLPALLWPLTTSSRLRDWSRASRSVRLRPAVVYGGLFAAGLALFAARTWWYTGAFSLFLGTSLKNNDTGLRFSTLGSVDVWRRVAHSLSALVWMNEPPHFDPRALFVGAGVVMAVAGIAQLPRAVRVPAPAALVTLGAMASALFVHTHNYPGRMSIHLIPFAVATAVAGAARLTGRG